MEMVLKETLIGKQIYIEDQLINIDDINYQPLIGVVFIKSGNDGYKLSLNDVYEFKYTGTNNKIIPNRGKLKGKK